MTDNMIAALEALMSAIRMDYLNWVRSDRDTDNAKRFLKGIHYVEGPKYIKVMSDNAVWGFVMKADDSKFKAGDILKPASWKAPARNAARGNILEGGYTIRWTGPLHLT